jgi:hypothetical protein
VVTRGDGGVGVRVALAVLQGKGQVVALEQASGGVKAFLRVALGGLHLLRNCVELFVLQVAQAVPDLVQDLVPGGLLLLDVWCGVMVRLVVDFHAQLVLGCGELLELSVGANGVIVAVVDVLV